MMRILPILTYHYFTSRGIPCPGVKREDATYTVDAAVFDSHLNYLKSRDYQTISLEKITGDRSGADTNKCLITIDDGHISAHAMAFPLLMKYGLKAELFVSPGKINHKDFMTWAHLGEMVGNGMAVGSHGYTHVPLTSLSKGRLEAELLDSKKEIEDRLGTFVQSLALPMGYYNARCLHTIREIGYKYIFTSRPGYNIDSRRDILERVMIKAGHSVDDLRVFLEFNCLQHLKFKICNMILQSARYALPDAMYRKGRRFVLKTIGFQNR